MKTIKWLIFTALWLIGMLLVLGTPSGWFQCYMFFLMVVAMLMPPVMGRIMNGYWS